MGLKEVCTEQSRCLAASLPQAQCGLSFLAIRFCRVDHTLQPASLGPVLFLPCDGPFWLLLQPFRGCSFQGFWFSSRFTPSTRLPWAIESTPTPWSLPFHTPAGLSRLCFLSLPSSPRLAHARTPSNLTGCVLVFLTLIPAPGPLHLPFLLPETLFPQLPEAGSPTSARPPPPRKCPAWSLSHSSLSFLQSLYSLEACLICLRVSRAWSAVFFLFPHPQGLEQCPPPYGHLQEY